MVVYQSGNGVLEEDLEIEVTLMRQVTKPYSLSMQSQNSAVLLPSRMKLVVKDDVVSVMQMLNMSFTQTSLTL